MGSKRWMLKNGLGDLLAREVKIAARFVDLFTGSGAVACHVAERFNIQVCAFDLQNYSATLAGAVIGRDKKIQARRVWPSWKSRAEELIKDLHPPALEKFTRKSVEEGRRWCSELKCFPITRAYGGHYFSPLQSLWIDALRMTLPDSRENRMTALGALIEAASRCAAAPGHTAQPFQPTRSAKPFLQYSWERDVLVQTQKVFDELSERFANVIGEAKVCDANIAVDSISANDLVFLDPPYSGVHYSRFYHVLETITLGSCGPVSGIGRYPAPIERPRSCYSLKTRSEAALEELLKKIAAKKACAILTFPDHSCSNGLSGKIVLNLACKYFKTESKIVRNRFSTLGGMADFRPGEYGRAARQEAQELIILLRP